MNKGKKKPRGAWNERTQKKTDEGRIGPGGETLKLCRSVIGLKRPRKNLYAKGREGGLNKKGGTLEEGIQLWKLRKRNISQAVSRPKRVQYAAEEKSALPEKGGKNRNTPEREAG